MLWCGTLRVSPMSLNKAPDTICFDRGLGYPNLTAGMARLPSAACRMKAGNAAPWCPHHAAKPCSGKCSYAHPAAGLAWDLYLYCDNSIARLAIAVHARVTSMEQTYPAGFGCPDLARNSDNGAEKQFALLQYDCFNMMDQVRLAQTRRSEH